MSAVKSFIYNLFLPLFQLVRWNVPILGDIVIFVLLKTRKNPISLLDPETGVHFIDLE
jgi:hypothetical protein